MKKLFNFLLFLALLNTVSTLKSQSDLWGLNAAGGGTANYGALYSISPGATSPASTLTFGPYWGTSPQQTKLLQASNGKLYGVTTTGGANNGGVLYEYDLTTNRYTKKFDFLAAGVNTVGSSPRGGLFQASNGKLYGMTQSGGAGNSGVIYEYDIALNQYTKKYDLSVGTAIQGYGGFIEPEPVSNPGILYGCSRAGGTVTTGGTIFKFDVNSSTFTKIIDLSNATGATMGGNPVGNLVRAADNKLYCLTASGGTAGAGTIVQIDHLNSDAVAKVFDFNSTIGSGSQGYFCLGADGDLYGVENAGGANNSGSIFKYSTTNGTCTSLVDMSTGTVTGVNPIGVMTQLTNGKFYGMTRVGGANSIGVIYEYNPSGSPVYNKRYEFTTSTGSTPLGSLMLATNGKFYGVTSLGGNANAGVLFEFDPTTFTYTKKFDFNTAVVSQANGALLYASNGKFYGLSNAAGTSATGVLFEYDRTTNTVANKVDLSIATGNLPFGSLVQASNGNLYGMTSAGGTNSVGTIFEYNYSTGTLTPKIHLSSAIGSSPYGSLIQAPNGKLYGMTSSGGANSLGTLFEYNITGNTQNVLISFDGSGNGSAPRGSLLCATNGKLYGMTSSGGVNGAGVLFEYNIATSSYTKLVEFDGTAKGSTPYGSLIEQSSGVLYGMTSAGGSGNLGVIFEYNVNTGNFSKKVDFTGTGNGGAPYGTLFRSGNNGKLYGVTRNGGSGGNGVLFEYDPFTTSLTKKVDFVTASGTLPAYTQLTATCTLPESTTSIASSTAPLCQSALGALSFSINTLANASSYNWAFPAGASTVSGGGTNAISVNLNALSAGVYTYGVAGTNACGLGLQVAGSFTVNATPVITAPNGTICINKSYTLSPTGADSYAYQGGSQVVSPTSTSNYTIVGTNSLGCVSTPITVTVNVNSLPNVGSTTTNSVVCLGFSTSLSGTGASTYVWTGGVSNGVAFTPATAGNPVYTVTGTDANGCQNTAQRTITVNALPNVGSTTTNSAICLGFTTSLSGTGAISYVWTGGVSNGVAFTPATAGNPVYTVTGTDGNGCQNTAQRTLTVNALPTVGSSTTNSVICLGFGTSLSGTGASSYVWTGGISNGITFTPAVAGSAVFTVTGTDANGCQNTAQRTITVNALPTVGSTTTNSVICLGFTTSLSGTGATSYVWTGGVTNGVAFTPAAAGNPVYTVTGTDANGCQNTAQRTITVNALPNVGSTTTNSVICLGFTTSLSGTGAISYVWTGGVTNGIAFTPATAGTPVYTVTGTDGNGCKNTAQRTITVNTLPTVGSTTTNSVICLGFGTSLSGTGAVSYLWTGGISNGITFTPAVAGNTVFTVTGTDANGCQNTAQRTITVNALPTVGSSTTNSVICLGFTTSLSGTGATSYVWTGGVTNGLAFTPVTSGSPVYTVTGTDANGCQNTAQRTLTVNALPTVGSTTTNSVICLGFTTSLSGTGATSYTWTGGVNNGIAFMPATAGTPVYTVTGTDGNGCKNTAQRTITVNALPTVGSTITNSVICLGFATSLSGTGASSYVWTGGISNGITFTPAVAGNTVFTVTGTDVNGCQNTAQRTITVNALPTVGSTTTNSVICLGFTTSLSGTGANSYAWTGGVSNGLSFAPATTINYTVTGTDANGCQNTAQRTITVNALPNVGSTTTNSVICFGFTTSLNGTGANTYTWTSGVSNGVAFSPTITTNYTVSGTDLNGCQNTAQRTITVNALPSVSATATSTQVCYGGSVTVTGSGALANSYSWTPPGVTDGVPFTLTVSTLYTVIGTDANGCKNSASAVVIVRPQYTVSANSGSICVGNAFVINPTVTPVATVTFVVSGGSNTVTPTSTSVFTVTSIDAFGCPSPNAATPTVIVRQLPVVTAPNGAICVGSVYTITPSGASNYTYSSGSATVNPSSPGTYTYAVIGSSLTCVSATPAVLTLTVNALPTLSITGNTVICDGESTTLTAVGASTYNWGTSTGSVITVSPSSNTSYSVIGTDLNGCVSNTVTNVTVNPSPTITINSGVICSGASFTLIPGGAVNYTASGGTLVVTPSVTSSFSVTGTNSFGCVSLLPAVSTITVVNQLTVTITGDTDLCVGETTTLSAGGAGTYTWNSVNTNTDIIETPSVTTNYSVVGMSGTCSDTATVIVTVHNLPNVQAFSSANAICVNETATLSATGAVNYTWMPLQVNSSQVVISPVVTTSYSVVGQDANGCFNIGTVVQAVDLCTGLATLSLNNSQFQVYPNPNSGEFFIELHAETSIVIVNAIGEVVLSQDLEAGKNTIELKDEAKGIYFVKEKGQNSFKPIKIVKQ